MSMPTLDQIAYADQRLRQALANIVDRQQMYRADQRQSIHSERWSEVARLHAVCTGLLDAEGSIRGHLQELQRIAEAVKQTRIEL